MAAGWTEFWPELEVGGGEEDASRLVGELLTGACNKICITHLHYPSSFMHPTIVLDIIAILLTQFSLAAQTNRYHEEEETFIEEADRVMFGILEASLVASSEFDTDRNCLGAGTGFAASFGFGGMFTGFVIRISWAIELGRNGWGETKARFWIPLKLLALSFTLMITSFAGSFSFSHSESFSFSNWVGGGGGIMGG